MWFILVFLLAIWYYNLSKHFLSYSDALSILQSDADGFFNRFTKYDMKARSIKNISEYKNKIKNTIINPSLFDMYKVQKCINEISKLDHENEWLNPKSFHEIPWKIIVVKGSTYELGLPHTRTDCIVINTHTLKSPMLIEILLHEKLHVYQKIYKNKVQTYINKNYKPTYHDPLSRANPDTDGKTYQDKMGRVFKATYDINNIALNNVKFHPIDDHKYEHPLEYMVYELLEFGLLNNYI